MSSLTNNYLNAYIATLMESDNPVFEIEPTIPDYECVGVFDPRESICDSSSSENCEEFASSAVAESDSLIEINDPVYVNDDENLEAYMEDIRFYWLYYRLYNDFNLEDNSDYELREIDPGCDCYLVYDNTMMTVGEYTNRRRSEVPDFCYLNGNPVNPLPIGCEAVPGIEADINNAQATCVMGFPTGRVRPEVREGLENMCEHYETIFDGYVSCDSEILCLEETTPGGCMSSECQRSEHEPICDTAPMISLQGEGTITPHDSGSTRFQISLKDSKYFIPCRERENQELVWNINGAIQLEYADCPVLVYIPVGGNQGNGGSELPPAPDT
jgi:hypothetical protein